MAFLPRPRASKFRPDEAPNAYSPHATGVFRCPVCFVDFDHWMQQPLVSELGFPDRDRDARHSKCRWLVCFEGSSPSERWDDPGCNFLYSVDAIEPRYGNLEQRSSHRRSPGRGDGAGGLCGGDACGHVAGSGEYDTAESERVDPDHHHQRSFGAYVPLFAQHSHHQLELRPRPSPTAPP